MLVLFGVVAVGDYGGSSGGVVMVMMVVVVAGIGQ